MVTKMITYLKEFNLVWLKIGISIPQGRVYFSKSIIKILAVIPSPKAEVTIASI